MSMRLEMGHASLKASTFDHCEYMLQLLLLQILVVLSVTDTLNHFRSFQGGKRFLLISFSSNQTNMFCWFPHKQASLVYRFSCA